MGLEYLGQYWNAGARRVRLLGKGDGVVHDLTPHLAYPDTRADLLERFPPGPSRGLLLEAAPFPTVRAILQAESERTSVGSLLAPAWEAAERSGRPL
jgi:hypothetical protein